MDAKDNLSERDIKVLMALEENPMGTFDELSKLTGLAKSVVFNNFQKLEGTHSNTKSLFSVIATPNIHALGMEILDIIVQAPTQKQFEFLDEFCYEHPYTLYSSLIYGTGNGLYLQFRIPIGSSNKVVAIFEKMQQNRDLNSYTVLYFPVPPIYTTSKVKYWNHKSLKWKFNWNDWFKQLAPISDQNNGNVSSTTLPSAPKPKEAGFALKWIKRSDIYILVELVSNSRRKKLQLIDAISEKRQIKFTPQTFSRREKKIIENCISGYRLFIEPRVLDIHTTILLWGTASSQYILNLASALHSLSIPFLSTFRFSETNFLWYLHLPSTHLADLLFYLKPNTSQLRLYFVDHSRSRLYHFFGEAFDENLKKWKDSELFMVTDVLDYMDKWKSKSN